MITFGKFFLWFVYCTLIFIVIQVILGAMALAAAAGIRAAQMKKSGVIEGEVVT